MATEKQIHANQQNAHKSTGPTSAAGKLKVSGNRITHGILSNQLLIENERAEDYQALLDDLHAQLKPMGTLEQALVEKIAVTLWRQKRLVRAETASIVLESNPRRIASVVEDGMGLPGYGDDKIEVDDLQPPDQEQIDWCKAVVAEFSAVDHLDLDNLRRTAPLIYEHMASDAKLEEESIEVYFAETSMQEYLGELMYWCHKELCTLEKKAEQYPTVLAMTEKANDKLCIPWGKIDLLNKYQTALDNQLYKAMRALRDAQEWRFKFIAAEIVTVTVNPAEAA